MSRPRVALQDFLENRPLLFTFEIVFDADRSAFEVAVFEQHVAHGLVSRVDIGADAFLARFPCDALGTSKDERTHTAFPCFGCDVDPMKRRVDGFTPDSFDEPLTVEGKLVVGVSVHLDREHPDDVLVIGHDIAASLVDASHDAPCRGILLESFDNADFLEGAVPFVEQGHDAPIVGMHCLPCRIIAEHRSASFEEGNVSARPAVFFFLPFGVVAAVGHEEYHGDDHDDSDDIDGRYGRMQPHGGYERGRHRLDASYQPCSNGTCVGDALQVEYVGGYRADCGHEPQNEQNLSVNGDGNRPWSHERGGDDSAYQHGKAGNDQTPPFFEDFDGQQSVESQRYRRHASPEKSFGRNGERIEVPLGCNEERAADGEHKSDEFPKLRKAAHTNAHISHDDEKPKPLEHRAGAGIGIRNGCEVAHLRQQYAQQREPRDLDERFAIPKHCEQVSPVFDDADGQEDRSRCKQADAGYP